MSIPPQLFQKDTLGKSFALEYGAPMPERERTGSGYPVFGSNGIVGRHSQALVPGPGIVVGRKGSVGEVCWSNESFWPIDTAYYVVPKDGADLRWLYWLLAGVNLRRLDAATGVPGLNRNDVYDLEAHKPPPTDQTRIAAALDTVDEAIAKTEAMIAKLRQVRAGLLHDLLTRGLDEHGQLRDPVAHPEQFQDSPLGRIPKDWDVRPLAKAIATTFDYRGRTPLKIGMEWGGGEIPALSAMNVEMGGINLQKETYFGSPALYDRWMTQGHVELGDVLITMEAPLGNIAQIPDNGRYILSQRVVLLRPSPTLLTKDFLALQMSAHRFQKELIRRSSGSTAVGIQRAELEKIELAVPRSIDEQNLIASNMRAADSNLLSVERELAKLKNVRSGLMTDLLTGRVRVPERVAPTTENLP